MLPFIEKRLSEHSATRSDKYKYQADKPKISETHTTKLTVMT